MRISDKDIADLVKYFTEEMPDHESHLPALLDLRDLRKLARDFFKKEDAYKVSDWSRDQNERIAYEKAHDALKAHLEAKP